MIGGEWSGRERIDKVPLVPFRAVSHSRWRHIGSHIVAFSNVPRMCRAQTSCAVIVSWWAWGRGWQALMEHRVHFIVAAFGRDCDHFVLHIYASLA